MKTVLLIAYASFSTFSAKSGQRMTHRVQATQSCGRATTGAPSRSASKTFFGQKATQMPHDLHHFLLIVI